MEAVLGSQALKVPATKTLIALGASQWNEALRKGVFVLRPHFP